jgi:DNA-binding transcriptional LysR family regulator
MDLNQVDLNLLVALDALLSERSVTRAAQRLSIGQSAMSSTLGRLRKLLNDPVLVREGRTLVASPFAESIELPLRETLARLSALLTPRNDFDPTTDRRTFTVTGSDYVATTFLHPLLVRLTTEAPGVRLNVQPIEDDFENRLRRNQVDVVIIPREVFPSYADFGHQTLFSDHWVCAVDAEHPEVTDRITPEQFSSLPYLAISSGSRPSAATLQLEFLGVEHRTEFTVGLGAAPFLLRGTRLVTLIPHRLAEAFADRAGLRILDPPFELRPITETMVWMLRNDDEPGHRWLRTAFSDLADSFEPST